MMHKDSSGSVQGMHVCVCAASLTYLAAFHLAQKCTLHRDERERVAQEARESWTPWDIDVYAKAGSLVRRSLLSVVGGRQMLED